MELTKEQIKEKYIIVGSFNNHNTTWVNLHGKAFHINRQGERLYTAEFDDVGSFNNHNTTWAGLNGKIFHINRQGERLYTAEFDDVGSFYNNDTTWVELNGKCSHINRQGERLYTAEFDGVGMFGSYDSLEGYPSFYNRTPVDAVMDGGRELSTWIYHIDKEQYDPVVHGDWVKFLKGE